MKTAFLFPGQGSQFAGMGKSLAENFESARECFELADDALRFPLSTMCFEGPDEDLKRTEFQQPALLAVSIAAFTVLREEVGEPRYVAGHSLGEYSALVAAGSLDFGEALRLVNKRGRYMQDAVPAGVGAMAALLKLPQEKLLPILDEAAQGEVVAPAGFNSPDQIVISGNRGAVERAAVLAKAAGAKRAVLLPVSAPFHCPLMRPAQERLLHDLAAIRFADLRIPLINNWQAREIQTGEEARQGLYEQVPNPVRWTDTIRYLASNGVERWFEVGAGAVLSGLLRVIAPGARCTPFGEAKDMEKLEAGPLSLKARLQNQMLFYGRVKETEAQSLIDLLGRRPSRIELDRAALEIARIEYPDLDADACITELDHHALAIAERARDLSDGRSFIQTANEYLFIEAGFRGNDDDYYNPANCCLNRVLETRRGIPITLSVIYVEIARRLSKHVSGVGLPGHFIVRYDDQEYSALIDPYHGGAIVDVAQCCTLAQVESLDHGMLDPVDRRHIAMRIINNLRGIYFARREPEKALRVLDLLIEASPDSADEHKQRGVALLQQHRMHDALGAFKRYVELSPEAPDRERIDEQIRNIAFWIASRN